jgi:hypothetical protein
MRDVVAKAEIDSPHLVAVMQALRSQSIDYDGPFVTTKGSVVFRVEDKIVLDWELLTLWAAGKLNPTDVATLLSRIHA